MRSVAAGTTTRAGRLMWMIKQSFIDYVEALPDGEIVGERTGLGFVFSPTRLEGGSFLYEGSVHVTGHRGELDVSIVDPRIEHDGVTGTLSVVVDPRDGTRCDIARLGPVQRRETGGAAIEEVMLSHDGSSLFHGHYGPYARLAPLLFEHPLPPI